jgi:hypothetical protein
MRARRHSALNSYTGPAKQPIDSSVGLRSSATTPLSQRHDIGEVAVLAEMVDDGRAKKSPASTESQAG